MEKRINTASLLLVLALSGVMFNLHSSIGGPSAEKGTLEEEAEEREEGCSCSVCERLGSKV